MKLKCIIIDDEPLAITVIREYINKINHLEIVAECESAVDAFDILQKEKADILFLDIQMPELTGFDLLRTIKNPPKVIITTAYREYAVEGYELNVVDYLLKPFSFQRFLQAIQKVKDNDEVDTFFQKNIIVNKKQDEYIFLKVKRKLVKVLLNDILYIESLNDYINVYTSKRKVTTKMLLSEIEKNLPGDKFLRIHRSFIISLNKIEAISPNNVEIGDKVIPIGRSYKADIVNKLKGL
ncbi:MAG: response regulator transcription factor [bacterium]|nr:response regulator transcription factor [bacterium]